jgi:hypothetical protein
MEVRLKKGSTGARDGRATPLSRLAFSVEVCFAFRKLCVLLGKNHDAMLEDLMRVYADQHPHLVIGGNDSTKKNGTARKKTRTS